MTNKIKYTGALAIILALVLIGVWYTNQQSDTVGLEKLAKESSPGKPRAVSAPKSSNTLPLSNQVQQKIADKNSSENPFRFDVEYIFSALSEVRIDRDGELVLDGETLDLLEAAVSKLTDDLSESEVAELQELIALGLPGEAGDEAAKIFSDYYQYRSAEREFLNASPGSDIAGINSSFEQLRALRQAHLGYDVAEKLYGEEERASMFMIRAMKIQEDPNLSEEEKELQQLQLAEELEAHMDSEQAPVEAETAQWLVRFENFAQQRQYILDAGLSKAEQDKQIEDLLKQHFATNEIPKARNYRLP